MSGASGALAPKMLERWSAFKSQSAADHKYVASIIKDYRRLDEQAKCALLSELSTTFRLGDAEKAIRRAIAHYADASSDPDRWRALWELRDAISTPTRTYFAQLQLDPEALRFLLDVRADAGRFSQVQPALGVLDAELQHLFGIWFDPAFLATRRISWDAPATLLEKLIKYEAVHPIASWDDLRNRLDRDRRCYGLFHLAMPEEPLAFVEIALLPQLEGSVQRLLDQEAPLCDPRSARVAMFYSISNTQPGLRGIGVGGVLIERALNCLREEFPQIKTFATLSPAPLLTSWMQNSPAEVLGALTKNEQHTLCSVARKDEPHAALTSILAHDDWYKTSDVEQQLRPMLLRVAVRYLLGARRDGRPWDPVARFHLENGAQVDRVHWLGDTSLRGMRQSAGIMVSYLYAPAFIARNRFSYMQTRAVKAAKRVREQLRPRIESEGV